MGSINFYAGPVFIGWGRAFLSNGEVAWEIPRAVAIGYLLELYAPAPGWEVIADSLDKDQWRPGACGEYRRVPEPAVAEAVLAGV